MECQQILEKRHEEKLDEMCRDCDRLSACALMDKQTMCLDEAERRCEEEGTE